MFQAILPLSKYIKPKSVRTHDFAFALHSKLSVAILLTCTLLVSARQYFGQPIECQSSEKQLDFINLYCWSMGTYILADSTGVVSSKNVAAVGVSGEFPGSKRIYLRYYQWVVLILLLQAMIFLFPGFLWKNWEGGLMSELCSGLDRSVAITEKEFKERRSRILKFFNSDYGRIHRSYAKKYFLCEILNFCVCILNIILMNIFFNGFWTSFSQAIMKIHHYNWDEWNEVSSKVFPKLAKCEFFKYGDSGSRNKLDALCVLPLNILNEKIFALLYIWFLLLIVASAMHLTFRIIVASSRGARYILTISNVGRNQRKQVRQLIEEMSYSEWFLLMRIGDNVNPVLFAELVRDLFKYQQLRSTEVSV